PLGARAPRVSRGSGLSCARGPWAAYVGTFLGLVRTRFRLGVRPRGGLVRVRARWPLGRLAGFRRQRYLVGLGLPLDLQLPQARRCRRQLVRQPPELGRDRVAALRQLLEGAAERTAPRDRRLDDALR